MQVKSYLSNYTRDIYAGDLFDKLLTYDPKQRINADLALNHDFFWKDPMPSNLAEKMNKIRLSNFDYINKISKANSRMEPNRPLPAFNRIKSKASSSSINTLTSFPDRIF